MPPPRPPRHPVAMSMNTTPALPEPAPAELAPRQRIPFSFAKRHGLLVENIEGGQAELVHRADVSPESLLEARRVLGMPLKLREVTREEFDSLLQQAYEGQSGSAMVMDDLDGSLDLD